MARRRKTSFTEDLMDLVAMLPWWGGVLLALLSYLLLHRLAVQTLMPSSGDLPTPAIWKGLATAGQYMLPILCLLGLIQQAKAGAQTAVRKGPEAAGRQAATAQYAMPNCPTCAKP